MFRKILLGCGLAGALLPAKVAEAASAASSLSFFESFTNRLSPIWKPIKFHGLTEFATVQEGSNWVLRASAVSSASGIGAEVKGRVTPATTFTWRWKIDRTPPGGSETNLKSFDHTARLFVAFQGGLGAPRSINYVWANQARIGDMFDHPNSAKSKFIVLETGDAKAGEWVSESRNLLQDWKRLFGDDTPPSVAGLGIITDSDSTVCTVNGYYDDLTLR